WHPCGGGAGGGEGGLVKSIVQVITLTVLAVLVASSATATTFVSMTERALARSADAIVAGTVRGIETVADGAGAIRTLVSIEVERTYKGAPHDLVMLREPGGRVGGRMLWIAGAPAFTVGERDLLFLSADPDGGARVTALGMGQYHLDGSGDRLRAERRLSEPVLRRPRPRAPRAHDRSRRRPRRPARARRRDRDPSRSDDARPRARDRRGLHADGLATRTLARAGPRLAGRLSGRAGGRRRARGGADDGRRRQRHGGLVRSRSRHDRARARLGGGARRPPP